MPIEKGRYMTEVKVDLPSLFMVLSFTGNLAFSFFDPYKIPVPKEVGISVVICGFLLFIYGPLLSAKWFFW